MSVTTSTTSDRMTEQSARANAVKMDVKEINDLMAKIVGSWISRAEVLEADVAQAKAEAYDVLKNEAHTIKGLNDQVAPAVAMQQALSHAKHAEERVKNLTEQLAVCEGNRDFFVQIMQTLSDKFAVSSWTGNGITK